MNQAASAIYFPSIGRWSVTAFPRGWMYVDGFGIRQMTMDPRAIPASVGLGHDKLSAEDVLGKYIEKQMEMMGQHLPEAKFAGPLAASFTGADEAQLLMVRHEVPAQGVMLHVQNYVRLGCWLGIVTLTSMEAEVRAVRPDYDAFVKGLQIQPEPEGEQAGMAGQADADRGSR